MSKLPVVVVVSDDKVLPPRVAVVRVANEIPATRAPMLFAEPGRLAQRAAPVVFAGVAWLF
jgi:hypothetical protein